MRVYLNVSLHCGNCGTALLVQNGQLNYNSPWPDQYTVECRNPGCINYGKTFTMKAPYIEAKEQNG